MCACMYVCMYVNSTPVDVYIHAYIHTLYSICPNLGGKYPLATLSSAGKLRAGGDAQVTHCVKCFILRYTFSVPAKTLTPCVSMCL